MFHTKTWPTDLESLCPQYQGHLHTVIGLLRRKYTILENTLSVDFLTCNPTGNPEIQVPMIDRILRVCSGLVNLCGPIVPFD